MLFASLSPGGVQCEEEADLRSENHGKENMEVAAAGGDAGDVGEEAAASLNPSLAATAAATPAKKPGALSCAAPAPPLPALLPKDKEGPTPSCEPTLEPQPSSERASKKHSSSSETTAMPEETESALARVENEDGEVEMAWEVRAAAAASLEREPVRFGFGRRGGCGVSVSKRVGRGGARQGV